MTKIPPFRPGSAPWFNPVHDEIRARRLRHRPSARRSSPVAFWRQVPDVGPGCVLALDVPDASLAAVVETVKGAR
jgi:hypothetical protein